MSYELHPLCTLFPRMAGAEFDALCADIKANGLREPITTHGGMVLDGGNRYRACLAAGVKPTFREFSGDNLVSFVLSANLHRRHMSAPQQAAIVSSARDWASAQTHGGDRRSAQVLPGALETAKSRAAESGASVSTQRRTDAVAKADPALAMKVAHGQMSLPEAVRQVAPQLASRRAETATPSKAVKPKTAAEQDRERAAEDAFGDSDPVAMLEEMHKQVEELTALVVVAEADDLKAEAIKWRRISEAAQRAQSDYMDRLQKEKKEHERTYRWLARCGKAVGETDPDKIAAAVEAFARQHRQVPA